MSAIAYQIVELDPATTHFERHGSTLSMTTDEGDSYPRVVLRDCFPMSDSTRFISVRDATTEEHDEIGMLTDWMALADADREAAARELEQFYFVPRITGVRSIRSEFGFLYWDVDSDKGHLEFAMRDNVIRHARQISEYRWTLIDVNNARFEIYDLQTFDERSQKLVRRHLLI